MKDLCRLCQTRLIGNQCRWIFSSSAKSKLQVILSHVLGKEVTRDGRGEFLCGKCVFQLEKVVKCDVDINHFQEDNNKQIQRLQAEKDHLIQCIIHVYNKNNPDLDKQEDDTKTTCATSAAINSNEELVEQQQNRRQQNEGRGTTISKNRMRRCVSLDWIGGRSSLRGTRHRSQSMYLDLVHRKGPHMRHGFKGCSTSLQSLNRDFSSVMTSDYRSKLGLKKGKRLRKSNSSIDALGESQAKLLVQSTSTQPSIISDLIQLLCCICTHQISVPAGSRIPVLRRMSHTHLHPQQYYGLKDNKWKSLHHLAEEFDDEYSPIIVKVVYSVAGLSGQFIFREKIVSFYTYTCICIFLYVGVCVFRR